MKAQVVTTEDFRYAAEIRRLAVPAGSCSFVITTAWLGAKDPLAEHTAVQMTLDAEGLMALRGVIDAEVRSQLGGASGGAA